MQINSPSPYRLSCQENGHQHEIHVFELTEAGAAFSSAGKVAKNIQADA